MNARRVQMFKLVAKFFFACSIILSIFCFVPAVPSGKETQRDSAAGITPSDISSNIPIYFISNKGQVNEKALFYAKARYYTIWLTKKGLVFDSIINPKLKAEDLKLNKTEFKNNKIAESQKYERDISQLLFLDANKNPEIIALNKTNHRVNYLTGNDQSCWKSNIPTSKAVLYRELYPYIDLKIYGMEKQVEYDFIVRPGGNVSDIKFKYTDIKSSKIGEKGSLEIETEFGTLIHKKPECYQIIEGIKVEVLASFKKTEKNTYAFESAPFDKNFELIIDPLVEVNSKFIGGSETDAATGLVLDAIGMAYIAGITYSTDFPIKAPFQKATSGKCDAFVMKINSYNFEIMFSTYLGGSEDDYALDIAIDKKRQIYVTGGTESDDFPIKKAIQKKQGRYSDAFITKLNSNGQKLLYSTYLGGERGDEGENIAVDSKFQVYLTGWTGSEKFPTKKAFQKQHAGISDVFVAKLNKTGKKLLFSTFIGGSDREYPCGIVLNPGHAVWIAGDTESLDYPIKKAFQKKNAGEKDIFVTKLSLQGELLFSTYFGGSKLEYGHDIFVADKGMVYISGSTQSDNIRLKKPIKKNINGVSDIIVAALRPRGQLFRSTYLGGSGWETTGSIAADKQSRIFVSGSTESPDFPENKLTGMDQSSSTPEYGYLLVLNSKLQKILYTYKDIERPYLWPDSISLHHNSSGKLSFLFAAGSIEYVDASNDQENVYIGKFKIEKNN